MTGILRIPWKLEGTRSVPRSFVGIIFRSDVGNALRSLGVEQNAKRSPQLHDLSAKAPVSPGEVAHGAEEVDVAECWPVDIDERVFGVCGLPQQES